MKKFKRKHLKQFKTRVILKNGATIFIYTSLPLKAFKQDS